MLVSCSKILVIIVLAQYVTCVEFYKSKRVPPKYKEIRRTFSLKSKEENVDSEPAGTFLEKKIDQNTSIGNVETTDDTQSSFITISKNDNESSIDYPLKYNEENAKTEPVEADVNNNSDQDKESIDNLQSTEDKKPSFTSTVKPKRRPFNLRKISKPSKIDVNESDDRDKVSIDKMQTTNKKQFSLTTSTITAKGRNFNLRPLRNKGSNQVNAQINPVEIFVKDNIDEDKESIDDIQVTKEKKPSVPTTTIKPKRRFSNLRILKNRVEKVQSVPAKAFVIVNADQDKVSNGNLQTIREEAPATTTRKIKPLRRTLNVYSLKRKEEKTDSKLLSSDNVQSTEDEKVIITTSMVNAKIPPTLGLESTLKKKEQEGDSKFVETIVDEDSYHDKVSDGNIQLTGDKKPTMITSTVKHESPTSSIYLLEREEGNTDGETDEALIKENAEQDKVAIDNIQTIREKKPIVSTSTAKPKTPTLSPQSLKNKEENIDSEYVESIINDNTGQIKVSLGNVEVTGDKKLSVTTSTVKPKTSTSSLHSQKTQTDSDFIETLVKENEGQIKVSLETLKITGDDKPSHSINKDSNGASDEIIVNENTGQYEVSAGNVQATREKKVTFTTSTIKPRRRTLNLYSLKRTEENSDSKPVATLKNDRDQVTTSNLRATGDKKLRVTTSTSKPKTLTTSPHSLKKETYSESVETIVNENTGQITVSIGNVQDTRENKVTVTTSTIKPRTRTRNLYSLKRKEVNSENKPVATPVNEKINQDQTLVVTSNIRSTGDKKLSVTSSMTKPQRRVLNVNSLKKKEENTSSKPMETLVNTNIHQDKASTDDVQSSGDTKFNLISSTMKPKRLTLNLDSLKINEDNSESKSVDTFISKQFDREKVSIDNVQSEQATTNEKANSHFSTEEPKIFTVDSAMSENGSKPIIKTQRKIVVQNIRSDAESKPSTSTSSISNKDRHIKVLATQAHQSFENYYQTTTPYTQLEKTTQKHDTFIPIIGVENYVYAYNGDYHYSYEGGDGTKAFERGELKSADGSSNSSGVVGGYSYKDKDGNDFNLSYTAGEGGYRPVGAHLPTPPPIPPAIQRVLRILATKTTPEPITERIKSEY